MRSVSYSVRTTAAKRQRHARSASMWWAHPLDRRRAAKRGQDLSKLVRVLRFALASAVWVIVWKVATARDWYPWRYNRRLSILRRPLIQLSTEEDPVVLVMPSILAGTLEYLQQAALGRLPVGLFDNGEMRSYIGQAADSIGHEFNCKVAERFDQLEWKTMQEVSLTRLGGGADLGDVDVLAWRPDTGLLFAVECKSLRFDRTPSEIGERLAEYAGRYRWRQAHSIAEAS